MSASEKTEAVERLLDWVAPGDEVCTVLRHVSRSGMSRSVSPILLLEDGPFDASGFVARAVGEKFDRTNGGVKVGGCGMDMGFALVYDLARSLFPGGFECVGAGCPSNDHSNGDQDFSPHHHSDGGYALRQRWL